MGLPIQDTIRNKRLYQQNEDPIQYEGLCNNHEIQSVIVQEEGKKGEDKLVLIANPLLFVL